MFQDPVLYELDEGIARMTLDNPRQRNVLSTRTLELLHRYLTQAGEDPKARVIVIRSTGPVFSSGHDLNELVGHDRESYSGVFADCTRVMELIRLLPKPVIAQVQGLATAAGCQLVATCDLAVAAETAAFATPGVQIGLFCTTPGVAVGRAVAPKKAMEMLLTGTPIPAAEALGFGLINRVVSGGKAGGGSHGAGPPDRQCQLSHLGHREARLLPADGPGPARRLRDGAEGDGGQSHGGGCPRRHHRLPGKARAPLEELTTSGCPGAIRRQTPCWSRPGRFRQVTQIRARKRRPLDWSSL